MPEELPPGSRPPQPPHDPGLRKLLIYVFIALVLSVLAAVVAVDLVIRWFGQ